MLKASIPDFPNYDIYIDGRVVSRKTGRELKQCLDQDGYSQVCLCFNCKKKSFKIHRLLGRCFMIYSCDFKDITIDHIDRNNQNNSLANLRLADKFLQAVNKKTPSTNKTGIKNICFINRWKKFRFRIMRHGLIDTQYFSTLEEAIRYRDQYYED